MEAFHWGSAFAAAKMANHSFDGVQYFQRGDDRTAFGLALLVTAMLTIVSSIASTTATTTTMLTIVSSIASTIPILIVVSSIVFSIVSSCWSQLASAFSRPAIRKVVRQVLISQDPLLFLLRICEGQRYPQSMSGSKDHKFGAEPNSAGSTASSEDCRREGKANFKDC
jgi:hypothetical protein